MFFKSLRIYRFANNYTLPMFDDEDIFNENSFHPCGSQEISSIGWFPPIKGTTGFFHVINGNTMICAKREEKILPASVVNEISAEKVKLIEDAENRKLNRKERNEIKDDVLFDLRPKAFTKHKLIHAYFNDEYLFINAQSSVDADDFCCFLRSTLGSLPVFPIDTKLSPSVAMTQWLKDGLTESSFQPISDMVLESPDSASIARLKGDISIEDINKHIESGLFVKELRIKFGDIFTCKLTKDLYVKQIVQSEITEDRALEDDTESYDAKFDASFAIMIDSNNKLIKAFGEAFSGIV